MMKAVCGMSSVVEFNGLMASALGQDWGILGAVGKRVN